MEIDFKVTIDANKLQKRLGHIPKDNKTMTAIQNTFYKYCWSYIPKDKTVLADNVKITPQYVQWNGPYAHYQWVGEVYGPNFVQFDDFGNVSGWRSPSGKGSKHPTGRRLGIDWEDPIRFPNWHFKYTTPNTGSRWDQKMLEQKGDKFYKEVEKIVERSLKNG